MAKTKRRAVKRTLAAGRDRPRPRKSGAPKASKSGSRKPKLVKSAGHQKPPPASEIASLKRRLQTAKRHQRASAEILRAVTNVAGDAGRPLQFIAETTAHLFGAQSVSIQLAEGNEFTQEYRVGSIAKRIGSAYPAAGVTTKWDNRGGQSVPHNDIMTIFLAAGI